MSEVVPRQGFISIGWKLSILEPLKNGEYLIKQCNDNIVRMTLWERRCKNVTKALLKRRGKDVMRKMF